MGFLSDNEIVWHLWYLDTNIMILANILFWKTENLWFFTFLGCNWWKMRATQKLLLIFCQVYTGMRMFRQLPEFLLFESIFDHSCDSSRTGVFFYMIFFGGVYFSMAFRSSRTPESLGIFKRSVILPRYVSSRIFNWEIWFCCLKAMVIFSILFNNCFMINHCFC